MNRITVMGRLTKEVELRYSTKGTSYCYITVAEGKDKESTNFWNCVAYGRQSELLAQYFSKGKPILIEGTITQEKYTYKSEAHVEPKLTITNIHFIPKTTEVTSTPVTTPIEPVDLTESMPF